MTHEGTIRRLGCIGLLAAASACSAADQQQSESVLEAGAAPQASPPAGAAPLASPPSAAPPLATVQASAGASSAAGSTGAIPGSVIVRFKPALGQALRPQVAARRSAAGLSLPQSLVQLNQRFKASKLRPLLDDRQLTRLQGAPQRFRARSARAGLSAAQLQQRVELADFFQIELDPSLDPEQVARDYAADPSVLSAEPNREVKAFFTPNDAFHGAGKNWGLLKLQAEQAWDIASGSGVVVAVVDSGVDATHPDLAANIAVNADEIAGNGVDDDANGFIDDRTGWDFFSNDNLPQDDHGHGTHVAGTVAAVANNGRGVAGVAHGAKILPVRGLGRTGSSQLTTLISALAYAIDSGADVVNNSWGAAGRSPAIDSLVATARQQGVVVVSAAGNANQNACGFTPATAEDGITVSAFTATDAKAGYSNFGPGIDLAAPGGDNSPLTPETDVLSTTPATSFLRTNNLGPTLTGAGGELYMSIAGTSMASPHVAGVAALLLSQHPTWSTEQVRQALRLAADDVAAAGFDHQAGYGRVNAYRSLSLFAGSSPPAASLTGPYNCQPLSGTVNVTGTAAGAPGSSYVLDWGAGAAPTSFTSIATGAASVSAGSFGAVDTLSMPDGDVTLRLRTLQAPWSAEDRNLISVNNVFLTAPLENATLRASSVTVGGQIAGHGISSWTLDYGPGRASAGPFTTLASGAAPVSPAATLATWSTAALADGWYTLRLRVTKNAVTSTDLVNVLVDRASLAGFPRAVQHNSSFKSPKLADLDRDGTSEIIYGTSVFQSDGSVRPGWSDSPGIGRTNAAVANMDSDPDLEVVGIYADTLYGTGTEPTPNSGAPVVYCLNPDKSVVWTYSLSNPAAPSFNYAITSGVSIGDLNGDGLKEVVFTAWFTYGNPNRETTVFILNQNGSQRGRFTLPGQSFSSVALGDLDLDGGRNLVISSWLPTTNQARVVALHENGVPMDGWPQLRAASGPLGSPGEVDPILADLDEDMRLEVIVSGVVFEHDGTIKPTGASQYSSRGTGAVAPLDGVRGFDVVEPGGNDVIYWARRQDGNLLSIATKQDGNLTIIGAGENYTRGNPIVYDVNGDGLLEILASSHYGETSPTRPLPIYAFTGATGSRVQSFQRWVTTTNPQGWADVVRATPAIGDLNHDGLADLVTAAGGQVFAWSLGTPRDESPWGGYQRDLANTGTIPAGTGLMKVRHKNSGLCLFNESGNNGPTKNVTCSGGASVLFKLELAAFGQHRLNSYLSNQCVLGNAAEGGAVTHVTCDGGNAGQRYELVPLGSNGEFQLKNVNANKCLYDDAGIARSGACGSDSKFTYVLDPVSAENIALRAAPSATSTEQSLPFGFFHVNKVKDGDRGTTAGPSYSWMNVNGSTAPQSVDLDFGTPQTFNRVDVYMTEGYALSAYSLQFWDGAAWRPITSVSGNTSVSRKHVFDPVTGSKLRVLITGGPAGAPASLRLNEVEVYKLD